MSPEMITTICVICLAIGAFIEKVIAKWMSNGIYKAIEKLDTKLDEMSKTMMTKEHCDELRYLCPAKKEIEILFRAKGKETEA